MCSACLKSTKSVFGLSLLVTIMFILLYLISAHTSSCTLVLLYSTYKQMLSAEQRAESHVFLQTRQKLAICAWERVYAGSETGHVVQLFVYV